MYPSPPPVSRLCFVVPKIQVILQLQPLDPQWHLPGFEFEAFLIRKPKLWYAAGSPNHTNSTFIAPPRALSFHKSCLHSGRDHCNTKMLNQTHLSGCSVRRALDDGRWTRRLGVYVWCCVLCDVYKHASRTLRVQTLLQRMPWSLLLWDVFKANMHASVSDSLERLFSNEKCSY